MSGQSGRHLVADEMFPDGPGEALDFVDPEDGVGLEGSYFRAEM